MNTLFSIKAALPEGTEVFTSQFDEELKLQSVGVQTEDKLDQDILNAIIQVLNETWGEGYTLNLNHINHNVQARKR